MSELFSATPAHATEAGKVEALNPANSLPAKFDLEAARRSRIPMSARQQRLTTPDLPGWHLHWFNDEEGRVERAVAAGYQFVERGEVLLSPSNFSDGGLGSGTDMGSRVSQIVGAARGGGPLRAYLMKIHEALFAEDQESLQRQVDDIDNSIRYGHLGETAGDNRYVKEHERTLRTSTQKRN